MKRFSIKQLVITLIVATVLLNGAQFLMMDTDGYGRFDRETTYNEMKEDGRYSEDEMEDFMDRGTSNKGFSKSKRR